jgi:hypothetical protein
MSNRTSDREFRATIIIPADRQSQANTIFSALFDPAGGDRTFTTGLSATGNAPATHYWASMAIRPAGLAGIRRFARAISNAHIWITVDRQGASVQRLRDRFDKSEFRDGGNSARVRIARRDPSDILVDRSLQSVSE